MSNRSMGEEAYARVFKFKSSVPTSEHELLRDYLYKFSYNYSEARQDLRLLKQVNVVGLNNDSKLLPRIMALSLQGYALDMRRMTDSASRRSTRKLLKIVIKPGLEVAEIAKLVEIHDHYSFYVDKGIAHQDEYSVKEVLENYPDSETIEKDMVHLKKLYLKIVKENCVSYIRIDSKIEDYSQELEMLAKES